MCGELQRRMLLPAVCQVCPRDASSEFGTQSQRIAAAILERIHFLGDDISGLAKAATEHRGLLEHRHFGAAKAVELAHPLERLDDMGEGLGLGAEDVLCASDSLRGFHGARV